MSHAVLFLKLTLIALWLPFEFYTNGVAFGVFTNAWYCCL